jgi:hypothetical protein
VSQENPFVFPDNVMEYGEPQFFPGNCVGYLETILEETDEEFEEEEGCSGRHWWTADSDTDTDSVIRVDNGQNQQIPHQTTSNQSNAQRLPTAGTTTAAGGPQPPPPSATQCPTSTNLKSVENVEDLSVQSTFRSSASSRPFELEDLHLLDQLDLAFEETLMEPRRRSGFAAFGHQLHLLDQPLETNGKGKGRTSLQHTDELLSRVASSGKDARLHTTVPLQRSVSHDGERSAVFFPDEDEIKPQFHTREVIPYSKNDNISSVTTETTNINKSHSTEDVKLGNAESKETFGSSLSPSSSDSEPHEVAEEDFFYSSPGSEESEEANSSSDDSEKNGGGVVLAEFSLCKGSSINGISGGLSNNSFTSGFGSARNRRSFDSPSGSASSRLKSFRSFDSLNSLSGTELLFSKADTFPSFHYIKEDVEPGSSGGSGSPSSPRCNLTSCSTNDVPGATTASIMASIRETSTGTEEDESHSLPSHHSATSGLAPTFHKITKKNSYSSSTSTASSSSNSASGMMSTENLSEDSGIGPDGSNLHHHHQYPSVVLEEDGKISDEPQQKQPSSITQLERESAKDYISSAEFALNPLVFSSLSSSDASSNSPSMQSVPSLNNHEDVSSSSLLSSPSPAEESPSSSGPDLEKAAREIIETTSTTTSQSDDGGNNDTEKEHDNNFSSDSNLVEMGNENASFHTQRSTNEENKEITKSYAFARIEEHADQCINNQPDIDIDEASIQQSRNGNVPSSEWDLGLHPVSSEDVQVQIEPKSVFSCAKTTADKAESTETARNNGSEVKENVVYKASIIHNSTQREMNPLTETSNLVANINVPSHPSTQTIPQSQQSQSSPLPLPFGTNASHINISTEDLSQQSEESKRIPQKPDSDAEKPPLSAKLGHNSLTDDNNLKEDRMRRSVISSSTSSQENSSGVEKDDEGVGAQYHSVPPANKTYIEENEIQEDSQRFETKKGWNVNISGDDEMDPHSTYSHDGQLLSSSLITGSRKASSSSSEEEGCLEDHVSFNNMQNNEKGHHHHAFRRERSNSESEFESAESAVEEDIALAYAIVNSPTKGSASSSPTQELTDRTINSSDDVLHHQDQDHHVHLMEGESGPMSTLTGSPRTDFYSHSSLDENGEQKERCDSCGVVDRASPSHEDEGIDDLRNNDDDDHRHSTGTQHHHCHEYEDNNIPREGGMSIMKNASILLHHLAEPKQNREDSHSNDNVLNRANSKITTHRQQHEHDHDEQEAVVLLSNAAEFNGDDKNAHKPSRSVTAEDSSSTDVVHQLDHSISSINSGSSTFTKDPSSASSSSSLNSSIKVDKHLYYQQQHTSSSNPFDYIRNSEEEDEEELVLAKPIDPVHIGVAEVKKFTQLDSSVSRKPHRKNGSDPHHQEHHQKHEIRTLVGNSDSENIIRPVPLSKSKCEEAILGHSNFGFFGRSSSCAAANTTAAGVNSSQSLNLDLNSSVRDSVSSTSSSPSSHPALCSTTTEQEQEDCVPYGFPPSPSNSSTYPISEVDLHKPEKEGVEDDTATPIKDQSQYRRNKDVPSQRSLSLSGLESGANRSSGKRSKSKKRPTRDHPKDQHQGVVVDLHLEDIKCGGIHPENFTIPLGVYSAAVIAVAPSIPSKRLVFVNDHHHRPEGESHNIIRLHEQEVQSFNNPKEKSIVGKSSNSSSSSSLSYSSSSAGISNIGGCSSSISNGSETSSRNNITTAPSHTTTTNRSNTSNPSSTTLSSFTHGTTTTTITNTGGSHAAPQKTSSYSSIPPDVLAVVKQQTHSSGSESNKEETREGTGCSEKATTSSNSSTLRLTNTSPGSESCLPVVIRNTEDGMEFETSNNNSNGGNRGGVSSTGDSLSRRNASPSSASTAATTAAVPVPVTMRTYGARKEVEVVLVSSRTPSPAPQQGVSSSTTYPTSSSLKQQQQPQYHQRHSSGSGGVGDDGNCTTTTDPDSTRTDPPAKIPRTRVHFSPVVSEISWRESYIDQSSEFSGSSEDLQHQNQPRVDSSDYQGDFNIEGTKSGGGNSGAGGGSVASFTMTGGAVGGNLHDNSGSSSDSVVRPLYISSDRSRSASREREMSHQVEHQQNHPVRQRQPSPGMTSSSSKGPILVEKVEMRSSFLHGGDEEDDEEEDDDELERKLIAAELDRRMNEGSKSPVDNDNLYEDGELMEEIHKENVEFKSMGVRRNLMAELDRAGGLDLYEDVDVEIQPIENSSKSGSTTLSMVPDLLSQCENASNTQTHIDVSIEEIDRPSSQQKGKPLRKSHSPTPQASGNSEIPPPPRMEAETEHQYYQQQILPKIFAEDSGKGVGKNSDSKSNSSSSLNKTKKSGRSSFSLGKKSGDKDAPASTSNETSPTEAAKDNKASKGISKPGFFERLSKIRLSGSKSKKQKVHPKSEDEVKGAQPLRSANAVNVNGNSNTNGSTTSTNGKTHQPILKKSPANQPTPVIPNYTGMENDSEPDECHHQQAFESILEEIAGIKSIKIRMDKSNGSSGGTPERENNSTSPVKEMRSFAKRKQFYNSSESTSPTPLSPGNTRSCSDLDKKLSQFKEETSKTRDLVSKSHPDLELIEDSVRAQSTSPEPNKSTKSPPPEDSKKSARKSPGSEAGQKNEREWYKLLKSAAEKYYYRGSNGNKDDKSRESVEAPAVEQSLSQSPPPIKNKTGIVETDLDTGMSFLSFISETFTYSCHFHGWAKNSFVFPLHIAIPSCQISVRVFISRIVQLMKHPTELR